MNSAVRERAGERAAEMSVCSLGGVCGHVRRRRTCSGHELASNLAVLVGRRVDLHVHLAVDQELEQLARDRHRATRCAAAPDIDTHTSTPDTQ